MGRYWDPLAGEYVDDHRAPARPSGAVYGEVYELITGDPQDGPHPYVGKAKDAYRRVYGRSPSAHTSRASVEKDPWKARILPASRGFRVLERVPATGDPVADEQSLRLREAYWIDRLQTTYNDQRPKYEHGKRGAVRRPTRPVDAPRPPSKAALAERRARARVRRRAAGFLLLFAVATTLAVRVVTRMELPWESAPWTVGPAAGAVAAFFAFRWLSTAVRIVTRGRR